jgi:nudix-type nucleoside diphosphatase (YffH/AdpP family)
MANNITILDTKILSDKKYLLKEVTFTVNHEAAQKKEVYERTNSATVLLYNQQAKTVVLTRQLRLPTYLNGNEGGMLIECCAGMMDEGETAEACIKREAFEETGYQLKEVQKVYEAYLSPASVMECTTFFIAPYTPDMKVGEGGGLKEENEVIEVLEMPFEKAFDMVTKGLVRDAKTILLLQYIKMMGLM